MPTLRELIFAIRNPISGGHATRDIKYSDRQIADSIRENRNEILYESCMDKYGRRVAEVNPSYQVDLGTVPAVTVDITDVPEQWVQYGELIKKVCIPKPVDLPQNAGIVFFGYIDKVRQIWLPDVNYGELSNHRQYPPKNGIQARQTDATTIYIYGKDIDELCFVNVRIIPEKPEEATKWWPDGTRDCFDWDKDPYPIPSFIESELKERVRKKLFLETASLPDDNTNNEIGNAVN